MVNLICDRLVEGGDTKVAKQVYPTLVREAKIMGLCGCVQFQLIVRFVYSVRLPTFTSTSSSLKEEFVTPQVSHRVVGICVMIYKSKVS